MGVAPVARSQNDTTWLPLAVQSRLHVTTQKTYGKSEDAQLKHEYGLSCFAVNGSSGTTESSKYLPPHVAKKTFLELLCQETPQPIAPNILYIHYRTIFNRAWPRNYLKSTPHQSEFSECAPIRLPGQIVGVDRNRHLPSREDRNTTLIYYLTHAGLLSLTHALTLTRHRYMIPLASFVIISQAQ